MRIMSSRHPEALQPFHVALAGVMKFMNAANVVLRNSLVHLNEVGNFCARSHERSNARLLETSSCVSCLLMSIGSLK